MITNLPPKLTACPHCGQIQQAPASTITCVLSCVRCRAPLTKWRSNALASSLALAALILYPAAILLPMLRIERLGHASTNSIVSGIVALLSEGYLFVGSIVLLFSLVLPPAKLGLIFFLTAFPARLPLAVRSRGHRLVDQIGRWGMLDVLFVATLVAFVKLGGLVDFAPQPGVALFGLVVLLSVLASAFFDPLSLWSDPAMEPTYPEAIRRPRYAVRSRWLWFLAPLSAVVVVLFAIALSRGGGPRITIRFAEGHGIKPKDVVKYRGIVTGEVENVVLDGGGRGVNVGVRLNQESRLLMRRGSRFWIVRPQLDMTGAEGLETIIGAKYLAVLPGTDGEPTTTEFVGLEAPPLRDLLEPGGIDLILDSRQTHPVRLGTPIYYRGLRIGGVVETRLSSDSSSLEAVAYIRSEYKQIIRANSAFWRLAPYSLRGSVTGVSVAIEPLEAFLQGGIGVATPPDHGNDVRSGHRFELKDEAPDWRDLGPGIAMTPPPGKLPRLRPAVLSWTEKKILSRKLEGWLLPVKGGLVGPANLLSPPDVYLLGEVALTVDGERISVPLEGESLDGGLRSVRFSHQFEPYVIQKAAAFPQDCWVTTAAKGELLLAAGSFRRLPEGEWTVDSRALSPSAATALHGAALVNGDGLIIGLLIVDKGKITVSLPKQGRGR